MANIDVIRNTYGGLQYLENAVRYVQDERANYLDSYGVSKHSVPMAMDQMVATRRYFGKVSGNPLVHVVISYDSSVTDLEQAAQYAAQCAGYFTSRYQVIWCTHEHDTTNGSLHTHILINAVSYIDGKMIITGYNEMNAFCNYVSQVTGQKCRFSFDNKATY